MFSSHSRWQDFSIHFNDSILNHLFLPYDLPSSAENDYLIQSNHENEYRLLECFNEFLTTLNVEYKLPVFTTLKSCVRNWLQIQNITECSVSVLQSIIQNLEPGDFLPLYLHAQNAAILIEIDENSSDEAIISAWQVSLPNQMITSSLEVHQACFPSSTYRLSNRAQLSTTNQCELLFDLMNNTIEFSQSNKASNEFDEKRDVPISHYVCRWWIQQFCQIVINHSAEKLISFKKKYRDQIRWNDAFEPFRRSGLWMTIKVVFQTILTKYLGTMGTLVYKLLITDFLIYFINKRQISAFSQLSTDMLLFCLRKIARRLNKIEGMLLSMKVDVQMNWIQNVMQKIKIELSDKTPKADWQYMIEKSTNLNQNILVNQQTINHAEAYRHDFTKLKAYLSQERQSKLLSKLSAMVNSIDVLTLRNLQQNNSLPSISHLTSQTGSGYSIGIALIQIEIWIESSLNQWFSESQRSKTIQECFIKLLTFFESYQTEALKYYNSDPAGYSQFILTSLTIIRQMHEILCQTDTFPRLRLHNINIPNLIELFEYLILPTRDDMIRARSLFEYFYRFTKQPYPDILESIESNHAFGVYYASNSKSMTATLEAIQTQAKSDKNEKLNEIDRLKSNYEEFIEKASTAECICEPFRRLRACTRCWLIKQANNLRTAIYECPIPTERNSALAVIFELKMPSAFRCYRDILWLFINRFNQQSTTSVYEWLSIQPHSLKLCEHYTCSYKSKIKLISSTKSISQSHYSHPQQIGSTSRDNFIFENSLNVEITPSNPPTLHDEKLMLTPQLVDSNYKHLQYSLISTTFMQNRVIAEQSHCSFQLKPTQFIEFGSFRSGHHLQWMNLLSVLKLDSLPLDEESVAILLTHSITQYGPITIDSNTLIQPWCSQSHEILLDNYFVQELISSVNHLLVECGLNWQNELVLVIATVIAMRIFSICNSACRQHAIDLVMKCRHIGEKWIEHISQNISSGANLNVVKMNILRSKIVNIGIACLLTFSMNMSDDDACILSTKHHIISFLKAITVVHDNILLNKNESQMSIFMRNLMQSTKRILVSICPILSKLLEKTAYEGLDEFTNNYWPTANSTDCKMRKWKKRKANVYDGWYDGEYGSMKISIDSLTGKFLINGMSTGYLPDTMTSNPLFSRVFGNQIFEVQPSTSQNILTTKHTFHEERKIQYKFNLHGNSDQYLIVREYHPQTNVTYELIPIESFRDELPDMFVDNYSHWLNTNTQEIEFRPIRFDDHKFLTDKHYILNINTGFITTANNNDNIQLLMNRQSNFFQNFFQTYFSRLDEESHLYILRDHGSQITKKKKFTKTTGKLHVHLPRLGIAFKYDYSTNLITSREYPDMCVDRKQSFRTLTGLKIGLLLSPVMAQHCEKKHYLCRKLIVPYGQIQITRTSEKDHQTVNIRRSQSSTQFLHEYFVFILNDRLHMLQATDSPRGCLYLALLHAVTSHTLPDEYTGMTGMERAFQLLNSAGCYSDQPYDPLSLNILQQIATLSPKANYYPEHMNNMKKIEWNTRNLSYSLQHFAYYLIAKKLFETSEQWNFMHACSKHEEIRKLFNSNEYNEKLLTKLYWDYRDSYNPLARFSEEVEFDIQSKNHSESYQPAWAHLRVSTNYRPLKFVNQLYTSGDLDLKESVQLHCFPLNRWLTNEYQLKHIWIGLFKRIQEIKIRNQKNEIERFEILLDFLHYISKKCSTQPYYIQVLYSYLNTTKNIHKITEYPQFTQYINIEDTSVQPRYIPFSRLDRCKRSMAIEEIRRCFSTNTYYTNETVSCCYRCQ